MFGLIFLTILTVLGTLMIGIPFAISAVIAKAIDGVGGALAFFILFFAYIALLAYGYDVVITGWIAHFN